VLRAYVGRPSPAPMELADPPIHHKGAEAGPVGLEKLLVTANAATPESAWRWSIEDACANSLFRGESVLPPQEK